MSTVLRNIPYARFIRQARSPKMALVSTQAALDQAIESLKTAPWQRARPGLTVTMPASDPTQTASSEAYDAYKFSGDCIPQSGEQAAFVGMVAYRFKIPSGALGNTPVTQVEPTTSVRLYANKFLSAGLRIAAFTSNDADPNMLGSWEHMRGEVAGSGVGFVAGLFANEDAGTKRASNQSAIVCPLPSGAPAAQYLWIIVQLEDWAEIKWEYWIEGAGFLEADTLSLVLSKDGVELDEEGEEFVFPVAPQDFHEPSRVYGLAALPHAGFVGQLWGASGAQFGRAVVDIARIDYYKIMVLDAFGHLSVFDINTQKYTEPDSRFIRDDARPVKVWGEMGIDNTFAVLVLYDDGSVRARKNNYTEFAATAASLSGVVDVATDGCNVIVKLSNGEYQSFSYNSPSLTAAFSFAPTSPVIKASVFSFNESTFTPWFLCADGKVLASTGTVLRENVVDIAAWRRGAAMLSATGTVYAQGNDGMGIVTDCASLSGITRIWAGIDGLAALGADGTLTVLGLNKSEAMSNRPGIDFRNAAKITFGGEGEDPPAHLPQVLHDSPQLRYRWDRSEYLSAPRDFSADGMFDSDASRDMLVRLAVSGDGTLRHAPYAGTGAYGIAANPQTGGLSITASAVGLRFSRRATDLTPTKLHYSLPALPHGAGSQSRYIRVVALLDQHPAPVNPIATADGFRTIWSGAVPEGYQILGSEYLEHKGFENSRFLPIAATPFQGVIWLIVLPVHLELSGDSLAFNVEGDGFAAQHVFLYRD